MLFLWLWAKWHQNFSRLVPKIFQPIDTLQSEQETTVVTQKLMKQRQQNCHACQSEAVLGIESALQNKFWEGWAAGGWFDYGVSRFTAGSIRLCRVLRSGFRCGDMDEIKRGVYLWWDFWYTLHGANCDSALMCWTLYHELCIWSSNHLSMRLQRRLSCTQQISPSWLFFLFWLGIWWDRF